MITKNQILKLDYRQGQGLLMDWSFGDVSSSPKYFYHLFIIYSNDLKSAHNFITTYIKYTKPGDFYSTVYVNDQKAVKVKDWRERLIKDDLVIQHYMNEKGVVTAHRNKLLEMAEKQSQDLSDPVVVNILVDNNGDAQFFANHIKASRLHQSFNYICSIFGPFRGPSLISISQGINQLSTVQEKLSKVLSYFQNLLNQATVLHATLSITSNNGCLSIPNDDDWQSDGFNRIVRHYYAPTSQYTRDLVKFMNMNYLSNQKYQLTVQLTFVCFDRSTFRNQKSLVINFDRQFNQQLTICPKRFKSFYFAANGMQLVDNPFASETIVRFTQQQQNGMV